MKTVEKRYEALENINVMDNFTVGNVTQNVKEYLLGLKVDDMTLFIAAEQGGGKTIESVLVIVLPKAKVASRKWMHTEQGREVKVKDKIEYMTTFAPHESPAKKNAQKILKNF